MIPSIADEAAHPPGAGLRWSDAWQLDVAASDGTGLTVRLECYPNQRVAWFWTYLVRPGVDGPIVVRDHEVPLPRQGLEVRAEGLWAELWCETAWEHWTYGLEAFAVRLDEPADALSGEIGERLPIGLDLEWETAGVAPAADTVHAVPDGGTRPGYVVPGAVHGEVLLARERFELDATGVHRRSWGGRDWSATGAWTLGCVAPAVTMYVDASAGGDARGFIRLGDAPFRRVTTARRIAADGRALVVLDDAIEIDVGEGRAAPVPIDRHTFVDRALCEITVGAAAAYGWSSVITGMR